MKLKRNKNKPIRYTYYAFLQSGLSFLVASCMFAIITYIMYTETYILRSTITTIILGLISCVLFIGAFLNKGR